MNRYLKIPYELLSLGLSGNAIVLYGIILNLAFKDDVYATNGYLAKQLNVGIRQIQNLINELKAANVINVRDHKGQRLIKPLIICDVLVYYNPEPLDEAPRLSDAPQCVKDFFNAVK